MENIIKCEGFSIEKFYFEKFNLQTGGYLSIDFSKNHDNNKIEEILYEVFSGKKAMGGVMIYSEIIPVKSPTVKLGPSIFKRTAHKFLNEHGLFSTEDINRILEEMNVGPKTNIYSLGANERKLLSLEAAYSKTKNVIICTSGLDYNGLEKVRNRIKKEMNEGSVLEISYPTSRGRDYLFDESQSSHKEVKELSTK